MASSWGGEGEGEEDLKREEKMDVEGEEVEVVFGREKREEK